MHLGREHRVRTGRDPYAMFSLGETQCRRSLLIFSRRRGRIQESNRRSTARPLASESERCPRRQVSLAVPTTAPHSFAWLKSAPTEDDIDKTETRMTSRPTFQVQRRRWSAFQKPDGGRITHLPTVCVTSRTNAPSYKTGKPP